MNPVLDASVLVAVVSPSERHHKAAVSLYDRHPEHLPFLVPGIFAVEVVAALRRRGEGAAVLDLVEALIGGPRFVARTVDSSLVVLATGVARRTGVRAYDAVYAAVALEAGAPLFTLDTDLQARLAATYPDLAVNPLPPA